MLYLLPSGTLQRRIPQTPPIPLQLEPIDQIESQNNTQQIAPKGIHDDMIPPALLEIIQHIPEGKLDDLESDRSHENELQIPGNQSFHQPPCCMGKCKNIEESVLKVGQWITLVLGIQAAIAPVGYFLVVMSFEIPIEVGMDDADHGFLILQHKPRNYQIHEIDQNGQIEKT